MTTRQKLKTVLYSLFFLTLFILLGFWLYYASLQTRDYRRLSDIRLIQEEFNRYYAVYATFDVAGCRINEPIAGCFYGFSPNIISDPLDVGVYRYLVRSLTEDNYEIEFSLEVGLAGVSPGTYILTKNGIRR
jgi:hypothetical protein